MEAVVFDLDGVSDIAHQLGYFETIASWRDALSLGDRLRAVTAAQVHDVARATFTERNRTIGWFEPAGQPSSTRPAAWR